MENNRDTSKKLCVERITSSGQVREAREVSAARLKNDREATDTNTDTDDTYDTESVNDDQWDAFLSTAANRAQRGVGRRAQQVPAGATLLPVLFRAELQHSAKLEGAHT